MLIGKYGSGHQYSHLLIVRHSLESGTNSHLRLAEAHVTAHQASIGRALSMSAFTSEVALLWSGVSS